MRVYLTGFMGSGKTSVGESLARNLGMPFVDLDRAIEIAAGATVREIFERQGETEFRRMEREALAGTLALEDAVIATGGGTLTFAENAELVAGAGLSVWLNVPFAVIVSRLGVDGRPDRPLFRDETQAFALYRERLAAYQRADIRLDIGADEQVDEVAARLALRLGKSLSCAT
ncbi:MAG: shikimate kinase [Holophagales bacterium]|nr:MAG: shikimate kinase [Holophagales bacterium]